MGNQSHPAKPSQQPEASLAWGTRYGIVTPYTSYLITEPGYKGDGRDPRPPRPGLQRREGPWDDRRRGDRAARTSSGSGGTPTASPVFDADESILDMAELKKESGGKAVDVARKVKGMKDAQVAGEDAGNVREAGGKTFRWENGGWVDEGVGRSKGKRIRIKPYGEAYFALAAVSNDVARYLALGEKVTFVFKGIIIELAKNGAETIPAELKKLL